ncbi:unnamed protein product [Amoebophrya sp. A25]|nr:unnamed protein product [Amoebophrya sp. A25]|eukprot:GSA25T00009736001.1
MVVVGSRPATGCRASGNGSRNASRPTSGHLTGDEVRTVHAVPVPGYEQRARQLSRPNAAVREIAYTPSMLPPMFQQQRPASSPAPRSPGTDWSSDLHDPDMLEVGDDMLYSPAHPRGQPLGGEGELDYDEDEDAIPVGAGGGRGRPRRSRSARGRGGQASSKKRRRKNELEAAAKVDLRELLGASWQGRPQSRTSETFEGLFSPKVARNLRSALETVERLSGGAGAAAPNAGEAEQRISFLLRQNPGLRKKLEETAEHVDAAGQTRQGRVLVTSNMLVAPAAGGGLTSDEEGLGRGVPSVGGQHPPKRAYHPVAGAGSGGGHVMLTEVYGQLEESHQAGTFPAGFGTGYSGTLPSAGPGEREQSSLYFAQHLNMSSEQENQQQSILELQRVGSQGTQPSYVGLSEDDIAAFYSSALRTHLRSRGGRGQMYQYTGNPETVDGLESLVDLNQPSTASAPAPLLEQEEALVVSAGGVASKAEATTLLSLSEKSGESFSKVAVVDSSSAGGAQVDQFPPRPASADSIGALDPSLLQLAEDTSAADPLHTSSLGLSRGPERTEESALVPAQVDVADPRAAGSGGAVTWPEDSEWCMPDASLTTAPRNIDWSRVEALMASNGRRKQIEKKELRLSISRQRNRANKIKMMAELERAAEVAAQCDGAETFPTVVKSARERIERPPSRNRTFVTEKREKPALSKVPLAQEFSRADLGFAEPKLVQQMQGLFSPKSAPYYLANDRLEREEGDRRGGRSRQDDETELWGGPQQPARTLAPPRVLEGAPHNRTRALPASAPHLGAGSSGTAPFVDHFPAPALEARGWTMLPREQRQVRFREEVSQVLTPQASPSRIESSAILSGPSCSTISPRHNTSTQLAEIPGVPSSSPQERATQAAGGALQPMSPGSASSYLVMGSSPYDATSGAPSSSRPSSAIGSSPSARPASAPGSVGPKNSGTARQFQIERTGASPPLPPASPEYTNIGSGPVLGLPPTVLDANATPLGTTLRTPSTSPAKRPQINYMRRPPSAGGEPPRPSSSHSPHSSSGKAHSGRQPPLGTPDLALMSADRFQAERKQQLLMNQQQSGVYGSRSPSRSPGFSRPRHSPSGSGPHSGSRPRSGASSRPRSRGQDFAPPALEGEPLSARLEALSQPKSRPETAKTTPRGHFTGRLVSARGHYEEALVQSMTPQRRESRPGSRLERSGNRSASDVPPLAPADAQIEWTRNFLAARGETAGQDENEPPLSPTLSAIGRSVQKDSPRPESRGSSMPQKLPPIAWMKIPPSEAQPHHLGVPSTGPSGQQSPVTSKSPRLEVPNSAIQRKAVLAGAGSPKNNSASNSTSPSGSAAASPRLITSPRLLSKGYVRAASSVENPEGKSLAAIVSQTRPGTQSSGSRPGTHDSRKPTSAGTTATSSQQGLCVLGSRDGSFATRPESAGLGADGDGYSVEFPHPEKINVGGDGAGGGVVTSAGESSVDQPMMLSQYNFASYGQNGGKKKADELRSVGTVFVSPTKRQLPTEALPPRNFITSRDHLPLPSSMGLLGDTVTPVSPRTKSAGSPLENLEYDTIYRQRQARSHKISELVSKEIRKKTRPVHMLDGVGKDRVGADDEKIQRYLQFPLYRRQPNPVELEHAVEMDLWLHRSWNRKDRWEMKVDPVDRFLAGKTQRKRL